MNTTSFYKLSMATFAASICQRQASPRTISDEADLSLNNTPRYVPFWKTVHTNVVLLPPRSPNLTTMLHVAPHWPHET
jgi:hypothetical protein